MLQPSRALRYLGLPCRAEPSRSQRPAVPRFAPLLAAILVLLLSACAIPERLLAVPRALTTQAKMTEGAVSGPANLRFWVNQDPAPLAREGVAALQRERDYLARTGHTGPLPPAYFLAISGGSDNGAFGAGLLNGWSAAGGRPQFKIVTGVSTGALIAPLAFLGPDYDGELKEAFTTISKKDIYEERGLLAALFDDGLVDSRPLLGLVSRFVTPELLTRVGEEYAKGRLLLVGTANLDVREPVIWNMTAIAASGDPGALDLFRKVLVASASVPGVFPPVLFDVDVDGTKYQEMHVDGGAMAQVFLYPPYVPLAELAEEHDAERQRTLFVIRNASFKSDWATVDRQTLDIAERAVSSLISSQGMGDLYRIYLITQRDGIDYNLAFIDADFTVPHEEEFDAAYMRQLFDYGYELAKAGYPWRKYPPTYTPANGAAAP